MGREIKRVPVGFDWPLNKVWAGYLWPEWLGEETCTACDGRGYSPEALHFHDLWYGNAPFTPDVPLTAETPEVRAYAERNVASSPDYYGTGERAVVREAERLARLWNGSWGHHLSQVDVDALTDSGRLVDFTSTFVKGEGGKKKEPAYRPTADEVNRWSLVGFGHDSINAHIVIEARCVRENLPTVCATCGGHGSAEKFIGQRAMSEAWEHIEPPAGDGWQMWETVGEGSPVTPAFATARELAEYINPVDPEASLKWIEGSGWAPSMIAAGGKLITADDMAEGVTVA